MRIIRGCLGRSPWKISMNATWFFVWKIKEWSKMKNSILGTNHWNLLKLRLVVVWTVFYHCAKFQLNRLRRVGWAKWLMSILIEIHAAWLILRAFMTLFQQWSPMFYIPTWRGRMDLKNVVLGLSTMTTSNFSIVVKVQNSMFRQVFSYRILRTGHQIKIKTSF